MPRLFGECPFRVCVIAVILCQLSGPSIANGQSTQLVTIDSVVEAWRARKSHARTIDFHAVGTTIRRATELSASEAAILSPTGTGGEAVSVSEKAVVTKMRFVADEKGRIRAESYSVDRHFIEVFDGDLHKIYFPVSKLDHPSASITKAQPNRLPRAPAFIPLLMVYYTQKNEAFQGCELSLTKDKGVVDGRLCHILSCGENLLWVDPERDFVPTRFHWIRARRHSPSDRYQVRSRRSARVGSGVLDRCESGSGWKREIGSEDACDEIQNWSSGCG